ncbi:CCR4-NOT transcription complex subunit 1, putative [Plasmodium ovale]|uniref:CCR4-NOT transcription complex subunit 1, putative n=1 Tax=Plasmodium ovale TaxID=36330 RepID=A0A1D3THC9_PLAOA|nr:CCR4-NOT transcription complex subunit 1, putative [Plasmodium ovale]
MNNNFNINVQVDEGALNKYEVEVNGYFAKLYTGEITVNTMLDIMKSLSCSPKGSKNNDVYKSMLLILFNECRFFPKYPSEELDTTAQLFGKLIKHNLLISYGNTLAVALKCILEALRKVNDSKMFNFGITALEQFEDSLICYPSFLCSLISVNNLRQYNPQYVIHCNNLLNTLPEHFRSLPYIDASTIMKIKHLSEVGSNSNSTNASIAQLSNEDMKKLSTFNVNHLKNQNNFISNVSGANNKSFSSDNHTIVDSMGTNNSSNCSNVLNGLINSSNTGANANSHSNNINNDNLALYINSILPNCANIGQPQPPSVNNVHSVSRNENVMKNKNMSDNPSSNISASNFSPVNSINHVTNMNAPSSDNPSSVSTCTNHFYVSRSYIPPSEIINSNRNLNLVGNKFNLGKDISSRTAYTLSENRVEANIMSILENSKSGNASGLTNAVGANPFVTNTSASIVCTGKSPSESSNTFKEKEERLHGIVEAFYEQIQIQLPSNLNVNNISGFGLGQIECLMDNVDITKNIIVPSSLIIGEVFSIFNTLCLLNIDEKIKILKDVMQPEHYNWLAFYIVKSRASKEVNLHNVFLEFIDKLSHPMFMDTITNMTYCCILILFKYINELKEVSAFRTVLKNLGSWLGFITIGRNRPLKSKVLDLKLVLFEAYDKGCLVCILPMVCKILESIKLSKNFKPPNPWTTTMLCLLTEIHELPNVKTYIIFEVEVLFKNLSLDIHEYQNKTMLLSKRNTLHSKRNDVSMSRNANNGSVIPSSIDTRSSPAKEILTPVSSVSSVSSSFVHSYNYNNVSGSGVENSSNVHLKLEELENAAKIALGKGRINQDKMQYMTKNNSQQNTIPENIVSQWSQNNMHKIDPLTNDTTLVSSFSPPDINLSNPNFSKRALNNLGTYPYTMAQEHNTDNAIRSHGGNMSMPGFASDSGVVNSKPSSSKFLQSLNNAVIISPSIALFQIQPSLKREVPKAVDRAIREIISVILERSVAISCVTTREIICKDFCLEKDESIIRKASHIMIASLASSLALATCKEPLRISLTQHLRQLLQRTSTKDCNDQVLIEQVVQILSADNLELGCNLIEQVVIEKAIKDINEALAPSFLARQVASENSIKLNDSIYVMNTKKMQLDISETLNLEAPITNNQLQIYKDFLNIAPLKKLHAATKALSLVYKNGSGSNDGNGEDERSRQQSAQIIPPFSAENLQQHEGKAGSYAKSTNRRVQQNGDYNGQHNGVQTAVQIGAQSGGLNNGVSSDINTGRKRVIDPISSGNVNLQHGVVNGINRVSENSNQSKIQVTAPLRANAQMQKVFKKLEILTGQLKEAIKDVILLPPILFNINKEKMYDNTSKVSLHILYSLPVDGSLFNLIKSIPDVASATEHKNETITVYSRKIYKFLFEITSHAGNKTQQFFKPSDPTGIYIEVFMCILEKLKKEYPLLKEHITNFITPKKMRLPNGNTSQCVNTSPLNTTNSYQSSDVDNVAKMETQKFPYVSNNANLYNDQRKYENNAPSGKDNLYKYNVIVIAGLIRYNLVDMEKYKQYIEKELTSEEYSNVNICAEFIILLLKYILIDFHIFRYNDFKNIFTILNYLKEKDILINNRMIISNGWTPMNINAAIEKLTKEAKEIQTRDDVIIFSDLMDFCEEYLKSDDEEDDAEKKGVKTEVSAQSAPSNVAKIATKPTGEGRNEGTSASLGVVASVDNAQVPTKKNNGFTGKKVEEPLKRDHANDVDNVHATEKKVDESIVVNFSSEVGKSIPSLGLLNRDGSKEHVMENTQTNGNNGKENFPQGESTIVTMSNVKLNVCESRKDVKIGTKKECKKILKILMDPRNLTTLTQIIDFCLNTNWNILQKKKNNKYFRDKGIGGVRIVPKPQKVTKEHEDIISVIFCDWIKLSIRNNSSSNQNFVKFFQKISNKGLLKIDSNTDSFFITCIYKAVEGACTFSFSEPYPSHSKEKGIIENIYEDTYISNGTNLKNLNMGNDANLVNNYSVSVNMKTSHGKDTSSNLVDDTKREEYVNSGERTRDGVTFKSDHEKEPEVKRVNSKTDKDTKKNQEGTNKKKENSEHSKEPQNGQNGQATQSVQLDSPSDDTLSDVASTNLTFNSNLSNCDEDQSEEEEEDEQQEKEQEDHHDSSMGNDRKAKKVTRRKREMLIRLSSVIDGATKGFDFMQETDKEFAKSETYLESEVNSQKVVAEQSVQSSKKRSKRGNEKNQGGHDYMAEDVDEEEVIKLEEEVVETEGANEAREAEYMEEEAIRLEEKDETEEEDEESDNNEEEQEVEDNGEEDEEEEEVNATEDVVEEVVKVEDDEAEVEMEGEKEQKVEDDGEEEMYGKKDDIKAELEGHQEEEVEEKEKEREKETLEEDNQENRGADFAPMGKSQHNADMLDTSGIDALAKMIVCMMKMVDSQQIPPFQLFQRVMNVYCRIVVYESRRNVNHFNQRPYFRLFLSILIEMDKNEKSIEQSYTKCMLALGYYLSILNPIRVPRFVFAWLELISHKLFLPKILRTPKGWSMYSKLLVYLLEFLYLFLKNTYLTSSIRLLYRGTLRTLLILLHDFPEFLCVHNFALCNSIPLNCVQLRNLILSAFPRHLKLPHPFLPNLKVDLLPEMKVVPAILNSFTFILTNYKMKKEIDNYFTYRSISILKKIHLKLFFKNKIKALYLRTKYNIPLINSLILYVGMFLPHDILMIEKVPESHPSLELILYLTYNLDMEGRYYLLSGIANHLRYPNVHTHYFSCLLLWLFNISKMELVKEQITGILLERLIVHRPHPWGLLITFIELMKNPIFRFWDCSFVHFSSEIENLFHTIAQSCMNNQMDNLHEDTTSLTEIGNLHGISNSPNRDIIPTATVTKQGNFKGNFLSLDRTTTSPFKNMTMTNMNIGDSYINTFPNVNYNYYSDAMNIYGDLKDYPTTHMDINIMHLNNGCIRKNNADIFRNVMYPPNSRLNGYNAKSNQIPIQKGHDVMTGKKGVNSQAVGNNAVASQAVTSHAIGINTWGNYKDANAASRCTSNLFNNIVVPPPQGVNNSNLADGANKADTTNPTEAKP